MEQYQKQEFGLENVHQKSNFARLQKQTNKRKKVSLVFIFFLIEHPKFDQRRRCLNSPTVPERLAVSRLNASSLLAQFYRRNVPMEGSFCPQTPNLRGPSQVSSNLLNVFTKLLLFFSKLFLQFPHLRDAEFCS